MKTKDLMKTEKRIQKLHNEGFTLIELIVTIAIIAIFSGVVLTFVTTGSNTYRSTSSNAKVQMEAQETFDQIEELIIDVNRSLYYANGSGDSLGAEIKNDIKQSGEGNSTGNKTFIICNEYKTATESSQYICDVLDWDKEDETIYYSQREYKAASSSSGNETSVEALLAASDDTEEENAVEVGDTESKTKATDLKTKVERSVLATGILDFRADVSKVESDKIVRFQLSTANGTKEIETLHSISLRNTVEVKKPDDAYDDAASTNVGIKIINAPSSADPGNSYVLDYDLTGNGKIDLTTVTWEVIENTDNGSFPSADPTYGKLTISDTASGTITVIVSAKTVEGNLITSAPVTIPINGKAAIPESFTLSKDNILVAADGVYDLSTIVSGTLTYSDGTTAAPKNSIVWSLKSTCTGVSLSGNSLTVTNEAGKDSANGTVTLTATEKDSGTNKTAELVVRIARIDLTQPTGTYKVGAAKPQPRYAFTYMEAGSVVKNKVYDTMVTVNIVKTDGSNGNYITGADNFSADDVGEWNATISYDLSNRGGYGTVKDAQRFEVVAAVSGDGNIIINKNGSEINCDTIVAGRVYECAPTVNWGFNFMTDNSDFWINSEMDWYLKYPEEYAKKGITISEKNLSDKTAKISIADTATTGFIICADYIQYTDGTKTTVKRKIHGEKEVNLATGIELHALSKSDTAYAYEDQDGSTGYPMQVLMDVYDINGNMTALPVSSADSGTTVDWNNDYGTIKKTEDGNWTFLPSVYRVGQTAPMYASMQRVSNIFDCKNNYVSENEHFKSYIDIKISEPSFNAVLTSTEGDTIEPESSTDLYLDLTDELTGKTMDRTVKWSVDNNGHISAYETKSGEAGKITLYGDKPGTYTVTAQYYTVQNQWKKVTKTITVREPDIELEIIGPATGKKGGSEMYWLQVKIDGKIVTDQDVKWTGPWCVNYDRYTSKSNSKDQVKATFNEWGSDYKVIATVTILGKEYVANKIVILN